MRVAAGIIAPLLFVVAIGRLDLTVYGAFGAFGALTGVYGRMEPHWLRLRHQAAAGTLMAASVTVGVALLVVGLSAWGIVAAAAAASGLLSSVADHLRLRPSGPFFFLFAFTASAAVPYPGCILDAAMTVVGSVVVVLLVGFSGRLHARRRHPGRGLVEPPRFPAARILKHAGRYLVAVGVAGAGRA
ncbi:hypothetical protein [Arthrobacter sp. SDTb3-6]|uniref:hypothetical protein n=1 Tax=Arthrobacter sp. SDTb3-6 TaxID=2713571 RepID=UPI00159D0F0E|nr:hypothetical protein [Arthrobacter sp. SDTb3-6]NVM98660.1 hypothetical protein [Arthrobacter sp. SDTb3-6]